MYIILNIWSQDKLILTVTTAGHRKLHLVKLAIGSINMQV